MKMNKALFGTPKRSSGIALTSDLSIIGDKSCKYRHSRVFDIKGYLLISEIYESLYVLEKLFLGG